jgi:hypothetical protein
MSIPADHPLRQLFLELVWRHFFGDLQLYDADVAQYVTALLTDFTHADNLYRLRDARGRPLDDVGVMLLESNPLLEQRNVFKEREIRKHIGDYTLFMTGLFPEYVAGPRRRQLGRADAFVDYVQAGKESYFIVASFDQFEFRQEAPLFRRLSEHFEQCVVALNLVKTDLAQLRQDYLRQLEASLGDPSTPA